jgi:hypothetical protein
MQTLEDINSGYLSKNDIEKCLNSLVDKKVLKSKEELEKMLEKLNAVIFSKKVKKISRADLRKTMEKLGFHVILTNPIESECCLVVNEIMKVLEKS